jgi:hypothetical protein
VILHHQPGESVFLPFVILGAVLAPLWLLLVKLKNSPKRPLPPGYIHAFSRDGWSVIVRAGSIQDSLYDRRFQHAERDDGAPIHLQVAVALEGPAEPVRGMARSRAVFQLRAKTRSWGA